MIVDDGDGGAGGTAAARLDPAWPDIDDREHFSPFERTLALALGAA